MAEIVQIGDIIDLYTGKGIPYRTKIEDFTREGNIVVSTPLYRGIPIIVLREQKLELFFYRDNGRFAMDVKVADLVVSGSIRMLILEPTSEVRKQQRRDSFRLKKFIDVTIRDLAGGEFPRRHTEEDDIYETAATTEDISETGAGLRVHKKYDQGDRIYLRIYINWGEQGLPYMDFHCEIMQSVYVRRDSGPAYYRLGVNFLNSTQETRTLMAKYILIEQQKTIKQQRLVEGE